MLLLALSALEATLSPVWYRALSEEAVLFMVNNISPFLNFFSFSITLTMWILFINAIIKELEVSRVLWMIPALYSIAELVYIFLLGQNMLRVGTFITVGTEMLCHIIMIIVLWRYNRFTTDDSY